MSMQVSEINGITKVSLEGRLDSANVGHMELMFTAALVPAGKNAVVYLSAVTFLASLAIRMFISTTRALAARGGKVVLYGANEAVQDVIETMALDQIVPITATEAEALALIAA